MEYNNYYPVQSGHPLPNQQHAGGPQLQRQQKQQPSPPAHSGGQMMHSQMTQQTIMTGPLNLLQQMQQMQAQQQHIVHHPHLLNPQQQQQQQQQQHSSYQQIEPPHSHGTSVAHSSSPHAQPQHHHQPSHQLPHQHQHQHHNHSHSHQPNLTGQLPQTQSISGHVHSQSPHHHVSPMHMQHQQQSLNQMARPAVGLSVMNHTQPSMLQSMHHQHNFFVSSSTIPQQANTHHYSQNSLHPNHHQSQQHQTPLINQNPSLPTQHPQVNQNSGRNSSPYHHNISQTEFRIIELNRRLQSRPLPRHPYNPLPGAYDESIWWERFVSDFFEDDAALTLKMQEDEPLNYTIGRTLIPRFFRSYFTGGVTDLSFNLRNPKETCIHPHLITLDCDQASIVTNNIFRHPSIAGQQCTVVHTEGHLVIDFVKNSFDNLSIKSWRFHFKRCREYIDRSIISSKGPPANYLAEPITENGFPRSTLTNLKMCMIMEPMQELMYQNRQTKLDPRACLRKLLFDRYKFRSCEDNKTSSTKRRKRKPPASTVVVNNANTNKKSKAGKNNATGHNVMVSPSNLGPNLSLASQDVMVVGEPVLMGGIFGDDNITDNNEDREKSLENQAQLASIRQNSLSPGSQQQALQHSQSQTQHEQHQKKQQLVQQTPQHPQQPQQKHLSQNKPEQNHENQPGSHPKQVQTQDMHSHLSPTPNSSPKQVSKHVETPKNQLEFINHPPTNDHKIDKQDIVDRPNDSNQDSGDKESPDKNQDILNHHSQNNDGSRQVTPSSDGVTFEPLKLDGSDVANDFDAPSRDEKIIPVSEEPSEKENNGSILKEEDSVKTRKENHPNVMNSIPEDREDNRKLSPCDSIVAKVPPNVNSKISVQANGTGSKQNRRRSSERKETLREGLMRTLDFVIAIKDLKTDHPSSLWRITGNNLLQQFEPKIQSGIVLYESTNQYAGWNTEIRRDYIGVDVKVTHYNRHHLTVERLLLNLQNIEDLETFQDLHFSVYLQILISNVIDPLFGEGLQENPQHLDYYLPSRKIIEDIIKRYKTKILSKLKLNETTVKNFEKYPSLIVKMIESTGQSHMCRACNTNPSTQVVKFGNMSYDLHSYKPVKVTSEPTKVEDKNLQDHLCDQCLNLVQLYSEIHHMGWKFTNIARDKVTPLQLKGKSVRNIIEECINDEEWMRDNFEERDILWSKIERL